MAAGDEVKGSFRATWAGRDFNAHVVDVKDEFGPEFVAHRTPHRRGARQEEVGPRPVRSIVKLEFAGAAWRSDAALLDLFQAQPRSTFVHPIFGPLKAVVQGPIATEFYPFSKGNWLGAQVVFAEDTQTNETSIARGPAAAAQDVTGHAAAADAAAGLWQTDLTGRYATTPQAALYVTRAAAVVTLVSSFTRAAVNYAAAALAQVESRQFVPLVELQLRQLPALCAAAQDAGLLLPATLTFPEVLVQMEVTLQAATDLDRALRANLPPPVTINIDEPISLARLVNERYRDRTAAERLAVMEQVILANRLGRVDALRPGRLVVPA